jgi:hypothetical protein
MDPTRRGFLGLLAGVAAAAAFDPERTLWVPGAKTISIPAARFGVWINGVLVAESQKIEIVTFNWAPGHDPGTEPYPVFDHGRRVAVRIDNGPSIINPTIDIRTDGTYGINGVLGGAADDPRARRDAPGRLKSAGRAAKTAFF